ncbi:BACON domain-containing protein, partial [bacterium]|nr:BACON domain-containing protein [bacterium]
RLEYTFNVPPGVSTVYVFGEIEVHRERNDDSFWVDMNENNVAKWNGLVSLGHGWRRSWVYNQGKNTQQPFPVQPGENTLCLYPRESNGYINWLVITTDPEQDIDGFDFVAAPPIPADPVLVAQPSNLIFSTVVGEVAPAGQSITIINGGDGLISWSATEYPEQPWLELTNPSGSSGNAVTVAVNTTELTSGNYTSVIRFSDSNAINSPLDIPVTVTVLGNEPIISIAPAQLAFSAVENFAAPAALILRVTNSGRSVLNWQASAIPDVPWLQITPNSGGDDATVSISVDHATLSVGTYQTTITVADGNAVNSPQAVTVEFTVQAEPSGPVLAQFEAEESVSLPNSGWENAIQLERSCLKSTISDISSPPAAHRLEYTFNVPPGVSTVYVFSEIEVHQEKNDDSFWVDMNENNVAKWNGLVSLGHGWRRSWVYNQGKNQKQSFPVVPGENTLCLYPRESNGYINWLVITTDPNQDIQEFEFTGGAPPEPAEPHLTAQPGQLAFVQYTGEPRPAAKQVTISNSGDGNLNWTATIQPATNWLLVSPISGSAGQKLTVQSDGTSLGIGTYTADVRLLSAEADNSPLDVPVSLTVTVPQPEISASVESLVFSAIVGGGAPASVSVIVRNVGRSQLAWYATEKMERDWLNIQNA